MSVKQISMQCAYRNGMKLALNYLACVPKF